MSSAEIELKFRVASVPSLVHRLEALGLTLATPRTFEQNTLYDTVDRALRARGELLRLRRYGEKFVVTHKRHPDHEDPSSPYKVRIETESEVQDGEALAEIFCRLGFCPAFRYEKYRREFKDESQAHGCAVIDETPIGDYAELEGSPDWIDQTLLALGIRPADCLTLSYGKLFLDWRSATGSSAEDMTFAAIEASTATAR